VSLVETPFPSENHFERYVFDNRDFLGDLYVIKRQVRSGQRQGIPDMIAVDQDGHICVVEMKNTEVGEEILPQVLGYAIWADTNPDSIKALWLEDTDRPEDLEIDWDAPDVRVLVIAPAFRPSVPRMTNKINYAVDLLQVRRFVLDDDEFILINRLSQEPEARPRLTRGLEVYDRAFYETDHNKEAVGRFLAVAEAIEKLASRKGWALEMKFNKYYVGFKYGNKICFGVQWAGARTWQLIFKVSEAATTDFKAKHWQFQRYESGWKQAVIRCLDPEKADVGELDALFEAAYLNIVGL
jgi:hypothetical protein